VAFRNPDDHWTISGKSILAPRNLAILRESLENGPVIVEHRFYYGARSPDRLIFEDFDELHAYLQDEASPGDSFWIWDYSSVCRDDNPLVMGKRPDADGCVPEKGAY
jgi:NAD(P)H-flavin reductase